LTRPTADPPAQERRRRAHRQPAGPGEWLGRIRVIRVHPRLLGAVFAVSDGAQVGGIIRGGHNGRHGCRWRGSAPAREPAVLRTLGQV